MDTNNLKLIDFADVSFYKVTLVFGDINCAEYYGDDWNDRPYEHNAGDVYEEFVKFRKDVRGYGSIILQPSNIYPSINSGWSKYDLKERLTPCLLAVPDYVVREYLKRFGDHPSYIQALGHPRVNRIYYNDSYDDVMKNIHVQNRFR